MKKDLPKIFKNNINEDINNNMKVFYQNKIVTDKKTDSKSIDINKKIDDLLSKTGYIFNLEVVITTKKETISAHLAGKIKNYVITLDNRIIPIEEIIDIEEK